jgi:hydrogenase expression/formation protein HypE
VASALNELCGDRAFGIRIFENKIPLKAAVDSACEVLGLDPLYLANEGKIICVVAKGQGERAKRLLRKMPGGRDAEIFGEIVSEPRGKVITRTRIGGTRVLSMLAGAPLPRIC